jgi:hypothetical protein
VIDLFAEDRAHEELLVPLVERAVAIIDRLIDQATILRFSGKPFCQPREIDGAPLDGE